MSGCLGRFSGSVVRGWCLGMGILLAAVGSAGGQFLSEERAVEMALESNPQILAAQARLSNAKAGVWEATSNMLPTAAASYSKTRNREEVAFELDIPGLGNMGKQVIMPLETKSFSVDVTQPLFVGGALYQARRIASRGVDAARSDVAAVRQSVALQAREAYYNVIRAQGILEIVRETHAQVSENQRVVYKMFEVGLVPNSDVLRVDAALAEVEQSLQEAEEGVGLAKARLNMVLNRPLDTPVAVDRSVEILPFDLSLDACTERALRDRPDLRQTEANVDIAKRGVRASAGGLIPSVSLIYHYEWSDQETAFAPQDSWRLMGMLSYNLPLGFGHAARVKSARAGAREAERGLEQLEDGVELEVQSAWSALNVARKGLRFAERQLASATENRRVMDRRYREGEATYLDLLDAETLLTQAKVNNLSTRIDYRMALASLRKAMGEEE